MRFSTKGIRFTLKMKLRTKMMLLVAIVFAGFALSTLMGVYILTEVKVGGKLYKNIKNNEDLLERVALLKSDLNEVRAEELNLIDETDNDRMATVLSGLKRLDDDINEKFSRIVQLADTEEKKVAIADAEATFNDFFTSLTEELVPAVKNGERGAARALAMGAQTKRYERFIEQVGSLVDMVKMENDELEANAATIIRKKIISSAVIIGAIFLAILVSALIITRTIINPIRKGVAFAQSVAKGDLSETLEVKNADEIGDLTLSLNSMVGGLTQVVGQVNRSATELNHVSDNISTAAKQVFSAAQMQAEDVNTTSAAMTQINTSLKGVAQGMDNLSVSASDSSSSVLEMAASVEEVAINAENLADSVEKVSSSICEMAASIKQVGDSVDILKDASTTTASSVMEMDGSIKQVEINAAETAEISDELRRDAETGKRAVEATIIGINEIRRSSGITFDVVNNLSSRAEDIGKILSVIDEVTEQTSLLALNAAIIAAQAGEHGKGFAVVADEIKELAERTSSSTREIAQVIRGVQDETHRAVEAMNHAEKSIVDGELLSQKSGEALGKVLAGAEKATLRMGEIARATAEQSRGSQMIRDAMHKVSEMVEQIANATREQGEGSAQIMVAVERMKELTFQVKTSTREQSQLGSFIAKSTENITSMIQRINAACDEQSRGSEQIVVAVENIQRSTKINLHATKVMNDSVTSLFRQVGILQKEMSVFTIVDSTYAPAANSTENEGTLRAVAEAV